MADNRKYYYLKLKDSYFESDAIVLLESMPGGILYSNILLKMYLLSLKHNGKLLLTEDIAFTSQMIATLTRHQIGTVEMALKIFKQLGLIEELQGGVIYMTDIELMIGQSSTEAERKRAARRKNQALLTDKTISGHLSDICPPEIEIKKEIDIEKESDIERERNKDSTCTAYGKYQNVILTEQQFHELQDEFPDKWAGYIERLSTYIESSGKRYSSHAATIRKWILEDVEKGKGVTKRYDPDIYTFKDGESL